MLLPFEKKKGKKDNLKNYRLVIFTSVRGKIGEQVLLEHISRNMREKTVIRNTQLGNYTGY